MSQISETQNNGLNIANSPKEKQETNIIGKATGGGTGQKPRGKEKEADKQEEDLW